MKLSIITPTYNRANMLGNLYNSIVRNLEQNTQLQKTMQVQWLIIDDGSFDNTEEVVKQYIDENKLEIQYHKQENQGKMSAINHVVQYATGDLIVECDSDDIFSDTAFEVIKNAYEEHPNAEKRFYGICFLKYDIKGNNMGHCFRKKETTMFDLYFKEGENGEKAIVFYTDIRKQFKHELVNHEKFITEARMYHKMDENYKIVCYNIPIMICEYQKEGYTKNILEQFKKYPYGYYKYFQEILAKNMHGTKFKKRVYAIKHYILFENLTNQFDNTSINGFVNKLLHLLLFLPGKYKTKKLFDTKMKNDFN